MAVCFHILASSVFITNFYHWSLDTSVGIVNNLRAGQFGVCTQAGARVFSKMSRQALGPTYLVFSGYPGSFPGVKLPGRGADSLLHLALRSGMTGAIPLLPSMRSYRVHGQSVGAG